MSQISVIVPAYGAETTIRGCLSAIAGQSPTSAAEVIIVVSTSDRPTSDAAASAISKFGMENARIVERTGHDTPGSLNLAASLVTTEFVARVDAHCRIPPDYLDRIAFVLESRSDVAVTGGQQVAVPSAPGVVPTGIARALNNRLIAGWSRYRRGGHGEADTVYLGALRTSELRAVGGWDERLPTNQDFDLNRRMSSRGLVWVVPDLPVEYLARPTLRDLARQYWRFGSWKVRYWRLTNDPPRLRQIALLVLPVVIASGVVAALKLGSSLVSLAATTALLALALEAAGTAGPRGGLLARFSALAAAAVIALGWWLGVMTEALRLSRREAG